MWSPRTIYTTRGVALIVVLISLFISTFFLPPAYGELNDGTTLASTTATINETSSATTSAAFIERPIFKESEQTSILVHPVFNDNSTNVAFYMKCPNVACPDNGTPKNPVYIFSAENLGHGILPFSDYWAPPTLTDFIVIEYKNDNQQFTCSDKTLDECKADAHFVAITNFELVSNNTTITPEMLSAKNSIIFTSGSSSISSSLGTSTVVTSTIDGLPIEKESTVTATDTRSGSIGSFVSGLISKIIDAILPGDQSSSTSMDTPAVTPSNPTSPATQTATETTSTPIDVPVVTTPPVLTTPFNEPVTSQF